MHNGLSAALLVLIFFLAMAPAQATTAGIHVVESARTSSAPVEHYAESGIGRNRIEGVGNVRGTPDRPAAADGELIAESQSAAAVLAGAPQPGSIVLTGSALIALGLALKKARKKA